jgi:hypothetical protein
VWRRAPGLLRAASLFAWPRNEADTIEMATPRCDRGVTEGSHLERTTSQVQGSGLSSSICHLPPRLRSRPSRPSPPARRSLWPYSPCAHFFRSPSCPEFLFSAPPQRAALGKPLVVICPLLSNTHRFYRTRISQQLVRTASLNYSFFNQCLSAAARSLISQLLNLNK